MTPETPTTPHQRFLDCMRFRACDRPPFWESGYWRSTLRRWQREAIGDGNRPSQYRECDARANCGVDFWMLPKYETEVLAEDDAFITKRSERGVVERVPKSPDEMSMPQHMAYPVQTVEDWRELRKRFDPATPARFPPDWSAKCLQWKQQGPILILQGPRSPSLFGFVRELMGPERALTAFHDEPGLIHDMMECITELTLALVSRALSEAPVSGLFWWEDMCYRSGPLISPAMFRAFMLPRYRRVTALARSKGVDVIFVDSDGDVSELIPLWLESGINGVYPMEVAAGMDVVKLRSEYGCDLLMTGGIDKRVLVKGPRAIDAELEVKIPLAERGGYVPHIDHSIPHDVPYEHFVYYWKRKKELLGIRD